MSEAHVQADLLAYLDDELTPAERTRVEAHVDHCHVCAQELEQLRALRQVLDGTVSAALSSVRLSREADDRIREVLRSRIERAEHAASGSPVAAWFAGLWSARLRLAQAALALVLVFFSLDAYRVVRLAPPVRAHEITVLGEGRLAPGSQGALRVIIRDVAADIDGATAAGQEDNGASVATSLAMAGSPVAGVSVIVSLLDDSGARAPLFTGVTDALGTVDATFTVPELPEGQADLMVETQSPLGLGRVVQEVAVARTYKIFVSSDKPAYRPGQAIGARAVVLDAVDLRPVTEGTLQWQLMDAAGAVVDYAAVSLSVNGIGSWSPTLPAGTTEGDYWITAAFGDTQSERAVRVEDYVLPAFRVDLSAEQDYLTPGQSVTGFVEAETFVGLPVRAGVVTVQAALPYRPGQPVAEVSGLTDDQGVFHFELPQLPDLPPGELILAAQVVDSTGEGAGIRRILPVSDDPILVNVMPESGALAPGVANNIVIMTTRPNGAPVAAEVQVSAMGQTLQLVTNSYGLGTVTLVPEGDVALEIVARDNAGSEVYVTRQLAVEDVEAALLLHVPRATYDVGEALVARALVAGDLGGVVYLDVLRAGQMVAGLSAPIVDHAAEFVLDLGPGLVGTLELRAYVLSETDAPLRDTRLVVVDPVQELVVDIEADRQHYAPGDVAQLTFQTAVRRNGDVRVPTPTVLGISAVDASVYALDVLPPGFARTYMLIDDQILSRRHSVAGLDLPGLLAAQDEARQAQDLAAQAAWADVPVSEAAVQATTRVEPPDTAALARERAVRRLLVPLIALPLLALVLAGGYLRRELAGQRIWRRLVLALLVLMLLAPLFVVGLVVGWLLPRLGSMLFAIAVVAAIALLIAGLVIGVRRRWGHLQLFVGLLITYVALAGWLLVLAGQGAGLSPWALLGLVGAFILLVIVTVVEGQLLLVQDAPGAAWSMTGLALTLVVLAVTVPSVPALRSEVAGVLGNPVFYVGPLGWLSGCSAEYAGEPPTTIATEIAEAEAEAEPDAGTEAEPEDVMPTPAGTPLPAPTATPAPLDLPAEPYPLRQIFPETLYWNPEIATDAQGRLMLDLPLADSATTWQVTALALTDEGMLGAASRSLVASQALVLEVTAPPRVRVGEPVTLTMRVYNTTEMATGVRWVLPSAAVEELMAPAPVVVPALSGEVASWVIRPERSGLLPLEIGAIGERNGDRVLVEIDVVP